MTEAGIAAGDGAASSAAKSSTRRRYTQLAVLVLAGGCVYPLVYLRGNYEISILESFGITVAQLSQGYALLGVMFILTYLPSGWLADRVSPRWLISFSLASTGFLGLWYATFPSFEALQVIFAGWGITTGLTFWSALIKAVAVLGRSEEQGRFFGILDGGRGLVEAALATVAVAWFAYYMESLGRTTAASLQQVIYVYVAALLVMSPVVALTLDDIRSGGPAAGVRPNLLHDLKLVVSKREIWLCAFCILCGYQLIWASTSFSAYMQESYGMTAVTVGFITVAQLWMRPIGAISAGVAGDLTQRETVLAWLFVASAIALASILVVPETAGAAVLLVVVLIVGLATYAVRGIYWGTLESCNVPASVKGLAIGAISLVGYSPDFYLPLIYGALLEAFPGRPGYTLYFAGIAAFGLLGAIAAWRLRKISAGTGI